MISGTFQTVVEAVFVPKHYPADRELMQEIADWSGGVVTHQGLVWIKYNENPSNDVIICPDYDDFWILKEPHSIPQFRLISDKVFKQMYLPYDSDDLCGYDCDRCHS